MYRDMVTKIALLATVFFCSVVDVVCANQEYGESLMLLMDQMSHPFHRVSYRDALACLHADLTDEEIVTLVRQQGGMDCVTHESIDVGVPACLVVLPGKRHVLPLKTVVQLVLEGYRCNPFTRAPFTDAFCNALSTLVAINCTQHRAFPAVVGLDGDQVFPVVIASNRNPYRKFLYKLCDFYLDASSEGLMQPIIPLLRVDERKAICGGLEEAIACVHNATLGPAYNRNVLCEALGGLIITAQIGERLSEQKQEIQRARKKLKRNKQVSQKTLHLVRNYWVAPFKRVLHVLSDQDALLEYGMHHEHHLRDWRHWKEEG